MRLALVATLALLMLTACVPPEEKALRDHIYDTYYSTLAKERGDRLTEFVTLIEGYDQNNLPPKDFQLKMLPILEAWIRSTSHFEEATAADAATPRLKAIRDAYMETNALFTYAITEWWSFADDTRPVAERRNYYASYAHSYVDAVDALNVAYRLARKEMGMSETADP